MERVPFKYTITGAADEAVINSGSFCLTVETGESHFAAYYMTMQSGRTTWAVVASSIDSPIKTDSGECATGKQHIHILAALFLLMDLNLYAAVAARIKAWVQGEDV